MIRDPSLAHIIMLANRVWSLIQTLGQEMNRVHLTKLPVQLLIEYMRGINENRGDRCRIGFRSTETVLDGDGRDGAS